MPALAPRVERDWFDAGMREEVAAELTRCEQLLEAFEQDVYRRTGDDQQTYPTPAKIKLGMPVEVVFKDALGRKDREGNTYLSYFFQPRSK